MTLFRFCKLSRNSPSFVTLASALAAMSLCLQPASALSQTVIITQPQNEGVTSGSNVTFSVSAESHVADPSLPDVASGSLQLWLKADAGVVTNSSGQVSLWQDQSPFANNALQGAEQNQPTLMNDFGVGTNAALLFNGVQDGVNGSYLMGSGDCAATNAMTTFVVYNAFNIDQSVGILWLIGQPPSYGCSRCDTVYNQDMDFDTWAYSHVAPFVIPINTCRIWTSRVYTNLTAVDLYDTTATTATNFTLGIADIGEPAPGYYIGGLNPAVQYASPDNFDGEIAEFIDYNGYLTESDRLAVQSYLEEKYYNAGTTNGLSYQWQFDGTNIVGATNSTLTLTNVTSGGLLDVIVDGNSGRVISSNATLTVGLPPAIATQPQPQTVAQGTNATFTVAVNGTGPFTYQWYFDNSILTEATNGALTIANIQPANAGYYFVTVASPFGSVSSSNAPLVVQFPPIISGQPRSQYVQLGHAFTLSAFASGSTGFTPPPAISSGTLQLWLKADAGVETNSSGQVTAWRDQSGHANDATPLTPANQPQLVSTPIVDTHAALQFNGLQDGVNGSYLAGANDLQTPDALTAFTVYNALDTSQQVGILWLVGQPPAYGASRCDTVFNQDMDFDAWFYSHVAPFAIPTHSWRIWTSRVDTNLDAVELYDNTATSQTNFVLPMSNLTTPAAGYYVGGLNPAVQYASPDNFDGDIAEIIYYRGYLTDADRLSVLNYLRGKYFEIGFTNDLTYQWQLDGTNILGATNSTLTIASAQNADAGLYDVIVSDPQGQTLSSNAAINVGIGSTITAQPQTQNPTIGAAATLSVSATGTAPLTYQWQFMGAAIPDATNASYTLDSVAFSNLGSYTVVISNAWLTVTSSPALLELNPEILINGQAGTNFAYTNVRSATVQISSTFTNPSIFYTLDGSTPDFNATPYNAPFSLTQSAIVRAVAYDADFNAAQSIAVNLTLIISNGLTIVNPGGGTVAVNPPGALFRNTQVVQLTATPTNGWTFLAWSGTISSTNPVVQVSMTNTQKITAVFGSPIAVVPPTNGSILFNPPGPVFAYGSTVDITAVPAPGYYLALWGGGTLSGTANPFALVLTKPNPTVAALFTTLTNGHYSLTVIPNGHGSLNIFPLANSYASNASVQIVAMTQTTNRFYYWTGNVSSPRNPLTINVRSNTVITANFTGGQYPLALTTPQLSGPAIHFSLTGVPQQIYDVDVSTDLANWTLFNTVTNTNGSVPFSDWTTNAVDKYYRAALHQ